MRDEKEAARSDCSTQSGSGQMNFDGFDLPDVQFITRPTTEQPGIERFLLHGRENALAISVLKQLTGLHPRQITKAVQDARRRGIPVLSTSCPGGYFIAATAAEKELCIKSLIHREAEVRTTRICLEFAKIEDEENGRQTGIHDICR